VIEQSLKSDNILSQIINQSLSEKIIDIDEERISLLIFKLGESLFAFYGSQAREILPFTEITWIPGATAQLPGVVNIRGDVAAVLELTQVLNIHRIDSNLSGTFLIMVRVGDGRTGILVDSIVDVVEIPVSEAVQILPTLDERFKQFAVSQFAYKTAMVTILDAAQIIEQAIS